MSGLPHTPEEKAWAKKCVKKLNGELGVPAITKAGFVEIYKKKFNKDIKATGLTTWFRTVAHPEIYSYAAQKKRQQDPNYKPKPRGSKNPVTILTKSNFILIVAGNIMGFESESEVKAFLEQSQILGGVKLFVSKPVNIKFDIKIGG
jgi:hypothetical protein